MSVKFFLSLTTFSIESDVFFILTSKIRQKCQCPELRVCARYGQRGVAQW